MKSESSYSCLGSLLLLAITLAIVRYTLPAVWKIVAGLFAGAFYLGLIFILLVVVVLGYFTYKNLSRNKQKEKQSRYSRVTRVETLYKSLVDKLHGEMSLHRFTAEELLQSEILMKEKLAIVSDELLRLKDFASPQSQKEISVQLRDYKHQLRETKDPVSREVLEENISMIEQKRERVDAALEEIRQKEALVDLVYNSLVKVEEDLKFGRPVERLFPPDLYRRFDLEPPAEQASLPPLLERSDE